jgi:hypothetical protein
MEKGNFFGEDTLILRDKENFFGYICINSLPNSANCGSDAPVMLPEEISRAKQIRWDLLDASAKLDSLTTLMGDDIEFIKRGVVAAAQAQRNVSADELENVINLRGFQSLNRQIEEAAEVLGVEVSIPLLEN